MEIKQINWINFNTHKHSTGFVTSEIDKFVWLKLKKDFNLPYEKDYKELNSSTEEQPYLSLNKNDIIGLINVI